MRTVTGLFDSYEDANRAVTELRAFGVDADNISIVSNDGVDRFPVDRDDGEDSGAAEGASTGAGLGALAGGTGGLLAGLGILAIPGVGPVVAAGWLAATAAGVAAGAVAGGAAGGLIGAMTGAGISEEDAHVYAEGVRRGGTMVVARIDEARVAEAEAILQRSNRVNLADRRNAYEESGWNRFDENLPPYTEAQLEQERLRYRPGL